MSQSPLILVVGSINMDLVVRGPHMPAPGETVLGSGFKTSHGGKGANQAVAVARLGGRCAMIGCVGQDAFGEQLVARLEAEGVDCAAVCRSPDAPTGVAMIIVDAQGENGIVVASGANYRVTPDDNILPNEALFKEAKVVVLQLELPLTTVRGAIQLARKHGCRVILDPAPAPRVMPEGLCQVDILTPNVVECEVITGKRAGLEERVDKGIALDLIDLGAAVAVLKLGPRGSLVVSADGHFYTVGPYKVVVHDTTGAGDAFTGALAVAVARKWNLHDAAKFANAAGALACTKIGARSGMPTVDEVRILMEDQPI
jgi:ribokinase